LFFVLGVTVATNLPTNQPANPPTSLHNQVAWRERGRKGSFDTFYSMIRCHGILSYPPSQQTKKLRGFHTRLGFYFFIFYFFK
jgi:hypothetical protein